MSMNATFFYRCNSRQLEAQCCLSLITLYMGIGLVLRSLNTPSTPTCANPVALLAVRNQKIFPF